MRFSYDLCAMFSHYDPRMRRTLNRLSDNLESANESVKASLFSLSQNYLNPCLYSLGDCMQSCMAPCFPNRDGRLRRHHSRMRGRPEMNFDFYDDWEEEETDGLLGWGNDGLERLLGASRSYGIVNQSRMNYSNRRDRSSKYPNVMRYPTAQSHDANSDPTIIPTSSYFGFLTRFPWKIGGKSMRYRPSAADLQEHPGTPWVAGLEDQPLLEQGEEAVTNKYQQERQRNRSATIGSGHTTDSFSSRGDIFPSEDDHDAIPLGDEFSLALDRTAIMSDNNSNRTHGDSRISGSRFSTRTVSSRSIRDLGKLREEPNRDSQFAVGEVEDVETFSELKKDEGVVESIEDSQVAAKNTAEIGHQHADENSKSYENPIEYTTSTSPYYFNQSDNMEKPLIPTSDSAIELSDSNFDFQAAPDINNSDLDRPSSHGAALPIPFAPSRSERQDFEFIPARLPHFHNHPD